MSRFLSVILCALLLTGCASVSNLSSLDTAFASSGKGTVILVLTSNFPDVTRFDVLTLEATDQQESGHVYTVAPVRLSSRHSTNLFVFQLPPGNYRLKNAATGLPGTTHRYCEIRTHGRFDFAVEADTLSDLGRVVVMRTSQNGCDFARDFREPRSESLVQQVWPKFANDWHHSDGETILGWTTPADMQDRLKMLLAMRITPSVFNPVVRESDILFAGSELGQVLIRAPEGRWINFDTETSNTLFYVSPVNKQEMVLVGELNTFLYWKDRKFSKIDTTGLPALPLVYAGYHEGVGLIALLQGGSKLQVYRKAEFLVATWQQVSELEAGSTFWGVNNAIIKTRDNNIFVAATPENLYVFDASSAQWTQHKLPGTPIDMSVSPDGKLIVLANDGWYKRNFLSLDGGVSWEPLNKNTVSQLAYVGSGDRILMLDEGVTPNLMVTRDKGEHWETEKPARQGKLFVEDRLELVFGGYDHSIAGNEIFRWNGSAYSWNWERTTNFDHNRQKLQYELDRYLEKTKAQRAEN